MPHILQQPLNQIGLDQKEINTYLLISQNPNISVSDLSRETGLGRNKIYEILKHLSELGLLEHPKDYGRKIMLKSPSVIGTLLKSKKYDINSTIQNFEETLPSLITNFYDYKKEPEIKLYEGSNKFVLLMNQVLQEAENGTEMFSFNEGDDFYDIVDINYFLGIWIEERVKKDIFNKILVAHDNSLFVKHSPLNDVKLRQMKTLPIQKENKGCYWVIGNKVIHWDTANAKAVLILNQSIADSMKLHFEIAWNSIR
jgi:sugar-specific transcriptional regulator TrmB